MTFLQRQLVGTQPQGLDPDTLTPVSRSFVLRKHCLLNSFLKEPSGEPTCDLLMFLFSWLISGRCETGVQVMAE